MMARSTKRTGWRFGSLARACTVVGLLVVAATIAGKIDLRQAEAAAVHGAAGDQFAPLTDQRLDNLVAMTRLLGYVRFFHPADFGEDMNWDAAAIEGARSAESAANAEQLASALEDWIRQFAPTVRVRAANVDDITQAIDSWQVEDDLIDPLLRERPQDRSVKVLHWCHTGINLAKNPGPYFSRLQGDWLDADEAPDPEADPARPMVLDLGAGVCAVVPRFMYEVAQEANAADPFNVAGDANANVEDRAVRFAAIALAWTVLQHFYPYFDVVDTDWDAKLVLALKSAAIDEGNAAFHDTLRRLIASLHDGHGGVYRRDDANWFVPALTVDRVEGQWIVTHSDVPSIEAGDIIRSIDGELTEIVAQRLAETISAAHDGWMRHRLSQSLLLGPINSQVLVEVENPTSGAKSLRLQRSVHVMQMREERPETIEELEPGIWYVDMDRAIDDEVRDAIQDLADAKGVIFDMRGYPKGLSTIVISHLIDEPVTCAQWHVPVVTKPDRKDMTFKFSNWKIQPMRPRLAGNVAFIIDGRAISYAETYMGIIEHYKLAAIVGEPTAGTNGNVSPFQLLGGYHVSFTGMKVLKHDGSQHHGIGILPTVPCSRTIEGVRAGKDELLERAIEIVRGQ